MVCARRFRFVVRAEIDGDGGRVDNEFFRAGTLYPAPEPERRTGVSGRRGTPHARPRCSHRPRITVCVPSPVRPLIACPLRSRGVTTFCARASSALMPISISSRDASVFATRPSPPPPHPPWRAAAPNISLAAATALAADHAPTTRLLLLLLLLLAHSSSSPELPLYLAMISFSTLGGTRS